MQHLLEVTCGLLSLVSRLSLRVSWDIAGDLSPVSPHMVGEDRRRQRLDWSLVGHSRDSPEENPGSQAKGEQLLALGAQCRRNGSEEQLCSWTPGCCRRAGP